LLIAFSSWGLPKAGALTGFLNREINNQGPQLELFYRAES